MLLGLSSKFGIGGLGIGQLLLELGNDGLIGRIGSALDVGFVVADFVLVVVVFNVGGSVIVGAGFVSSSSWLPVSKCFFESSSCRWPSSMIVDPKLRDDAL